MRYPLPSFLAALLPIDQDVLDGLCLMQLVLLHCPIVAWTRLIRRVVAERHRLQLLHLCLPPLQVCLDLRPELLMALED